MAKKFESIAGYSGDELIESVSVWRTKDLGGNAVYFAAKNSRIFDDDTALLPEETATTLKVDSQSAKGDVFEVHIEEGQGDSPLFRDPEREQHSVKIAMLAHAAFATLSIQAPRTIITTTSSHKSQQKELRDTLGLQQHREKTRQDAAILHGPARRIVTTAVGVLEENDLYVGPAAGDLSD